MVAPKYDKRVPMKSEFEERARNIVPHGLGLSVDVYQPNLAELVRALRLRGLNPGYLEVFKATTPALEWVRRQWPHAKLPYHGEGLWLTQPDFRRSISGREGVRETCDHVAVLKSAWSNHEGATKHIAGVAFGTYLPPLYTELAARVTADNLRYLQWRLDRKAEAEGTIPSLALLEMPPLTYFACGSMAIPTFYRLVTEGAPCGLVLDIGHLWTVYRYTGAWRRESLESFKREFLHEFPLERVIEIHVAGLAVHPCQAQTPDERDEQSGLPLWIDAHGAAIPDVLFESLRFVLKDSRLSTLIGVALEVDTKDIPTIASEFERFSSEFSGIWRRWDRMESVQDARSAACPGGAGSALADTVSAEERARLDHDYRRYAALLTTGDHRAVAGEIALMAGVEDDLSRYREVYLPYELLHWGGDLEQMFPATCAALRQARVDLERFVAFWVQDSKPETAPFDFFLLKIERFLEFVAKVCPSVVAEAQREAEELRVAYHAANEPAGRTEVGA